jgi:hypothetical protein
VDINEQDHVAMPQGKLIDSVQEELQTLLLGHEQLRVLKLIGPKLWEVGASGFHEIVKAYRRAAALTPQIVITGVGDNAEEPRAKVAILKAGQRTVDFNQRILDCIGGGFFCPQNLLGKPLCSSLVMADETVKGVVIATTRGLDQFGHLHHGDARSTATFKTPVNGIGTVVGPAMAVALVKIKVVHGYLPFVRTVEMPAEGHALKGLL